MILNTARDHKNWNEIIRILIAYHDARINGDDIKKRMTIVCFKIMHVTHEPSIYDFCLRVIRQNDPKKISAGCDELQRIYDKEYRL